MDYQEKVLEHYNIELTPPSSGGYMADLSVYKNRTTDGYEIWMISHEGGLDHDHEIDWEHDVFMYKDEIPQRLFDQMRERPFEQWYIEDLDELFDDYHWADEYEKIAEEAYERKILK